MNFVWKWNWNILLGSSSVKCLVPIMQYKFCTLGKTTSHYCVTCLYSMFKRVHPYYQSFMWIQGYLRIILNLFCRTKLEDHNDKAVRRKKKNRNSFTLIVSQKLEWWSRAYSDFLGFNIYFIRKTVSSIKSRKIKIITYRN